MLLRHRVAAAGQGFCVGSPACVTTAVVGTPTVDPPPPTVLNAIRYGFHHQSTILVVMLSKDVNPHEASNPGNYTVLVPAKRSDRAVLISGVSYKSQTHQAALHVAQQIYIYRPWRLVVRGNITDLSGKSLETGGVVGRDFVTLTSLRSLVGPASSAPGASRTGRKPVPAGPLAFHATRVPSPQHAAGQGTRRQVAREPKGARDRRRGWGPQSLAPPEVAHAAPPKRDPCDRSAKPSLARVVAWPRTA
jgi:hypothetical protein